MHWSSRREERNRVWKLRQPGLARQRETKCCKEKEGKDRTGFYFCCSNRCFLVGCLLADSRLGVKSGLKKKKIGGNNFQLSFSRRVQLCLNFVASSNQMTFFLAFYPAHTLNGFYRLSLFQPIGTCGQFAADTLQFLTWAFAAISV